MHRKLQTIQNDFHHNSQIELMPDQNGIYAKSLLSSFPLIMARAILEVPFAALLAAKSTC
jgi:hypothetical protein